MEYDKNHGRLGDEEAIPLLKTQGPFLLNDDSR